MVQVLAEAAVANLLFQIPMSRHHHPHIDANRSRSAHALNLAFFQYAQQLRLHHRRHIADFIQKQRALMSLAQICPYAGTPLL